MIKYEWRTEIDSREAAELADMLARATAYDAEPEYSTIDFADVTAALERRDPHIRHLLIWMLPHATAMVAPDEPERIAALLRLEIADDGAARAYLVVDPRFRSIGIITLFVEQVGLDISGPDGWLGTGARTITAWALGNHPATGRLSNRFLIPRTRRIWKLIRACDSVHLTAGAPVLEPIDPASLDHLEWPRSLAATDSIYALRVGGSVTGLVALDFAPRNSEEFGACATATEVLCTPGADPADLRQLLDGAAAIVLEHGLTGLIVHVDSGDARLVNACRLVGFQHDRTDVCYQIGGPQ
ncbi:hypothetical protein [Mycolicibacterium parafortuitum]|uniref:Acetyltransferase [Rhodococcus jostii RHA1] n=1 Tax=Mycolicibacterium parafortuitum TaxID=39692 RepID=A0A375YIR2_MYCPF|nr:hypothetical protein [Mycolicibacterium parafortuitum]ORB32323.1 hypothetical protein BST38_01045 [Mycolicibacterium parafortuitum]SRX81016.1 acetyltransferase [Rhodococcus jostii RHA1] [Mycolicibacterium parafortuitum]